MSKSKIFQPKTKRIVKSVFTYLGKYITRQPLVFNLNFNVTNVCNQDCPMCNAARSSKEKKVTLTFDQFKAIIDRLKPYSIASLTISGGEPSLVKELPEMLEYAAGKFPFGINVNSNLYANEKIITRFAEAALRNNIRIGTSFDGFDNVADKLRGGKDVSKKVMKNMELVTKQVGS